MSNNQWWENDDDDDEFGQEPQAAPSQPNPRDLRSQLKAVLKERKELQEKLSTMQSEVRRASIKDYFRDKGINPKLAKYVPPDLDPTSDALDKWVEEDGELFNIRPAAPNGDENKPPETPEGTPVLPGAEGGNVTPDVQAEWNRLGATTQSAMPPEKQKELLSQIETADEETLRKLIFSHGGGGF